MTLADFAARLTAIRATCAIDATRAGYTVTVEVGEYRFGRCSHDLELAAEQALETAEHYAAHAGRTAA